jgi:ABC-type polysaccharide/polyol phosphate export permease
MTTGNTNGFFEKLINHKYVLNFQRYKYLLYEIIKKDIKLRYRRSFLGVFWILLSPILYTIILTVVFSTFFNRQIENFPVYLLCGRFMFDFFSQGTKKGTNSIMRASIIKRVYVPKYVYPLGTVIGSFITFLISLVILAAVAIITGVQITWSIVYIIVPFMLGFFLVLGLGLTLSTISIFFRDAKHLWGVFLSLIMWSSAIFYPASIIPEQFRLVLIYNPVFHLIDMLRNAIMYNLPPTAYQLFFVGGLAIFFLVFGIILLYKYQDKFILYMD